MESFLLNWRNKIQLKCNIEIILLRIRSCIIKIIMPFISNANANMHKCVSHGFINVYCKPWLIDLWIYITSNFKTFKSTKVSIEVVHSLTYLQHISFTFTGRLYRNIITEISRLWLRKKKTPRQQTRLGNGNMYFMFRLRPPRLSTFPI